MEFLRRWVPYVRHHGLVILEAHCVEPNVAACNIGALHNITFDTYHGLSHQYPVDYETFMLAGRGAGLEAVPYQQHCYPSQKPFVAVSINRFIVPSADESLVARDPADRSDRRLASRNALMRVLVQLRTLPLAGVRSESARTTAFRLALEGEPFAYDSGARKSGWVCTDCRDTGASHSRRRLRNPGVSAISSSSPRRRAAGPADRLPTSNANRDAGRRRGTVRPVRAPARW